MACLLAGLAAIVGLGYWADWMADAEKEEFNRTCHRLNAEAFYEGDAWVCVRDNEVVYP